MKLQDLILSVKDEQGWSFQNFEDHTPGRAISRGMWQKRASGVPELKEPLNVATMRLMAAAMGVTAKTIYLAVGEQLGIIDHEDESPLLAAMPARTDLLDEEETQAHLRLIRLSVMRKQREIAEREARDTPPKTAKTAARKAATRPTSQRRRVNG